MKPTSTPINHTPGAKRLPEIIGFRTMEVSRGIEDREALFLTALADLLQAGGSLADISRVIRSTNWAQVCMLADKAGYTGEKIQVNAQSDLKSVRIENDYVIVESESFGTFKLFLNDVQNNVVSLIDGSSDVFGEHDFGIISHDTDLWRFISDYVLPEVRA